MALINLDADEHNPGSAQTTSLVEAAADIAAMTGSARSTYRLKKDLERDEAMLREMVDRRFRLEDF